MTFRISPIFPKAVYRDNIARPLTEEEFGLVDEYRDKTVRNIGNNITIDKQVLNRPELADIKNFIIQGIINYHDEVIVPQTKIQFYITQSWMNYTLPSEYHHKHQHPNSIISGVFYFKTDPEVDKIVFYDDDYERIQVTPKRPTPFNTRAWWASVKTGDLVIFPSELTHMVEHKKGDNERVSLAFNVFARGIFGDEEGATYLKL